jgi:hypothetical protein
MPFTTAGRSTHIGLRRSATIVGSRLISSHNCKGPFAGSPVSLSLLFFPRKSRIDCKLWHAHISKLLKYCKEKVLVQFVIKLT